jgi:hypothetical protein
MDQHAVPQNITGYQFRLVGDMTLRQFGMLAGGFVLALLFYYSPFPAFFRYPFVVIFGLSGIGFAFIPINDMPLDRWVLAYFKAIYSPTQYFWRKEERIPVFMSYEAPKVTASFVPPPVQKTEKELTEYLDTISSAPKTVLDQTEQNLLQNYSSLLSASFPSATTPSPQPQLSVTPTAQIIFTSTDTPRQQPKPSYVQNIQPRPRPISPPVKVPTPQPARPGISTTQTDTPRPINRGPSAIPSDITPQTVQKADVQPQKASYIPPTIVFPLAPEYPNVIVGTIVTSDGKLIDNAIVEVRDKDGHPVRALKSNKVGQFSIGQPLKNGSYEIEIEKPGLYFDIIKFEARGEKIAPLQIIAKQSAN